MSNLSDKELIAELEKRFAENKKALKDLKSLNEQLKQVNLKLEESEAMKSHFISNITNEIVNPFTSILALSRQILSVKKEDWKRVISMVALIHSDAFNLDFQFKNIFVAAKLEAGEIYPEILKVNLVSLINNVVDSFKYEAKKKHLQLEASFSEPDKKVIEFKTDPEKIRLMLSNLLSNAIKFSYENQKIDIFVDVSKSGLKLIVKDYGEGISPENQRIIFDRFKRLDSGINSLNRGHGLGLSVNKALLDMLGGRIEVDSELKKGSTFELHIPESEVESEGFSGDGTDFMFEDGETF